MDLNTHTRDIWIALGTLSGLGIIVAVIRTWAWYSRSGRQIIDIIVRISLRPLLDENFHYFRHSGNFFSTFSALSVLLYY